MSLTPTEVPPEQTLGVVGHPPTALTSTGKLCWRVANGLAFHLTFSQVKGVLEEVHSQNHRIV